MIRPVLYTLALLGFALTAYMHDWLAGVAAGVACVLLGLYLREKDVNDSLLYVLACTANGVTPDGTERESFGDGK